MALLFADGFEDGTTAWTLTNTAIGTGRFGNGLVTSGTATSTGAETGFGATAGPIIAGFAFKPASTGSFMCFSHTAGSAGSQVWLHRGSGGEIIAYRSSAASLLGSSALGVLPLGSWSFVEAKATIHDTTGSLVVRVNGVEVLNLTNIDTKDGAFPTAQILRLGGQNAANSASGNTWDDVYIADTTGSFNNDFLGELSVEHLRPAADDVAQWVGSDGNLVDNWDLVNEAGAANTADYVGSATVGQRDLYVPGPSTRPLSSPVLAVMPVAVVMKTDAGTRTMKLAVKEGAGGTVRLGPDTGLPTSFGEIRTVFDRKGDGTAFTVADVNALRVGFEVAT